MKEVAVNTADQKARALYDKAYELHLDEAQGALELLVEALELAESIALRAEIAYLTACLSAVFFDDGRAFALLEWIRDEESLDDEVRAVATLQHIFLRLRRGVRLEDQDHALIFDDSIIERSNFPEFVQQIRAQYYVLNGAYESAFHAASLALELAGDELRRDPVQAVNIHSTRGFAAVALDDLGAVDEALAALEALVEIHPTLFIGQMVLRELRYDRNLLSGDIEGALRAMEEAEEIARANQNIWFGYRAAQIQLLALIGRADEARARFDDELESAEIPVRFRALAAHSVGIAKESPALLERAFELYAEIRLDEHALRASNARVELLLERGDPSAEEANRAHLDYLFDALYRAPTERDRLRIQGSLLAAVDRTLTHFLADDPEASLLLVTWAKSASINRIVHRRAERPGDASRDLDAFEHRALYDELTRVHPLSERPRDERAPTLEELQRALPIDVAALEIYLGSGRLHLFFLTSDELQSTTLELDGELDDAIAFILEAMSDRPAAALAALSFEAALVYVFERLIAPWEEALSRRGLLLLSHGALFSGIPFAALLDGEGRFLIERVAIAHITSFARLPEVDFSPAPPRSFRAIRGFDRDPERALIHAGGELAAARAIAERSGLIIKDSAPKKLIDYFDAELVHYAGHASPGNEHLMDIALPLSPTRELRAAELFAHDLRHISLITLAACETGGSLLFRGDEVGGFVRALSAAGVKRSLLARHPIDDAWTAEFLERVYAHYFAGLTIERALAEAIRELLHEAREAKERLSPALFGNFLVYL